jgi:hypothetical protein
LVLNTLAAQMLALVSLSLLVRTASTAIRLSAKKGSTLLSKTTMVGSIRDVIPSTPKAYDENPSTTAWT